MAAMQARRAALSSVRSVSAAFGLTPAAATAASVCGTASVLESTRGVHTSSVALSAHVTVPADPDLPNRKTVYDMTDNPLPAHQVHYDPQEHKGADSGVAWTPSSIRTGVVALKCGMTADWDTWGVRVPLTVLKVEDVQVVQVKSTPAPNARRQGVVSLQVGAAEAKARKMPGSLAGHYASAGVDPKRVLREFTVTPDAVVPVGTRLDARHFVPGQTVDVQSRSQGKGFQGAMKRWGFAGQGASHGVSKTHRALGGTGAGTDPGRVWKGKKMPGRMGFKVQTTRNLQVFKVDAKRGLVYVVGAVAGPKGTWVRLSDATPRGKTQWSTDSPPPFPTFTPTPEQAAGEALWTPQGAAAVNEDIVAGGGFLPPLEELSMREAGALPRAYAPQPPFEWVMRPSHGDPLAEDAHDAGWDV